MTQKSINKWIPENLDESKLSEDKFEEDKDWVLAETGQIEESKENF